MHTPVYTTSLCIPPAGRVNTHCMWALIENIYIMAFLLHDPLNVAVCVYLHVISLRARLNANPQASVIKVVIKGLMNSGH